MRLVSFRIRLFRSIIDTGPVDVGRITALVGKNDTGKTNILEALEYIHSPDSAIARSADDLSFGFSFPEQDESSWFVIAVYELHDADRAAIARAWPRGSEASSLRVWRRYDDDTQWFLFDGVASVNREAMTTVETVVRTLNKFRAASDRNALAIDRLVDAVCRTNDGTPWAQEIVRAVSELRLAAKLSPRQPSADAERMLSQLCEIVQEDDDQRQIDALGALKLPVMIYLDDYPDPVGRQNLREYVARASAEDLDESDIRFERLMQLSGVDGKTLRELLEMGRRRRDRILNEAGIRISNEFRKFWAEPVTVRFSYDNGEIDTVIEDDFAAGLRVVNLDDRSRGFRWFFAFFAAFASGSLPEENPVVLLLDEPGLHLHASAQGRLLEFFRTHVDAQVIYTTHSPYLLDPSDFTEVRIVTLDEKSGTSVSANITGDRDTLFPLQAALGLSVAQSLFIGSNHLIVEGVTDLWLISAISECLNDVDGSGLRRDIVVTPAGGASRIAYLASFLAAHDLRCVALFDSEPDAVRIVREGVLKQKLLRDESIVFLAAAIPGMQSEADIEDVLDPGQYTRIVEEAFANELKGHTIDLRSKVPRIAKRFEEAFEKSSIQFNKTRPAKLLLHKIASAEEAIDEPTLARFRSLFAAINSAFEKIQRKASFERGGPGVMSRRPRQGASPSARNQ